MYGYNYTELTFWTLIYALSVYRFTKLLYEEDGPWSVFDWLRYKVGIYHELVHELDETIGELRAVEKRVGEGFFAELLNCPYCISGWLSLVAIVGLLTGYLNIIALWGAIWAIVYLFLKREDS